MNYYDLNGMIDIPKSESIAYAQNKKQIEEIDKKLSEHINEEKLMIEGEIQSLTENIDNAAAEAQRKLEDTAASINSDMKELSNRIDRDMETVNDKIENTVDNINASVDTRLDIVNSRVDNIIANSSETEGNSELIDIRTGADAEIYDTAGKAVRQQITNIKEHLKMQTSNIKHINILDPQKMFVGKYINLQIGGNLNGYDKHLVDTPNLVVSPMYSVAEGDVINIRLTHSSYSRTAIADKDKKIIYTIPTIAKKEDYTLTVPEGGKYLIYCGRIPTDGSPWETHDMIALNTELTKSFTPFGYVTIENYKDMSDIEKMNVQWQGKVCSVMGTSLTANGGWTDIIKERLRFSKVYNRGIGGTTLTDFSGQGFSDYNPSFYIYSDRSLWGEDRNSVFSNTSSPETEKINKSWYSSEERIGLLPEDSDLVLVDLAVNDYFRTYNAELEWSEIFNFPHINTYYRESIQPTQLSENKFGDAFALMIRRIQRQCPKAKIVVWGMMYNSAIHNYNSINQTPSDSLEKYCRLNNYIKNLCSVFGVYYINMLAETGVNAYNLYDYFEDGIHPFKSSYKTEKGKYIVANTIISHLKNIYPECY